MADAVQAFRAIAGLIFKWLLLATAGVIGLIAIGVGIYFAYRWYSYDRHAALVEPVIRIDGELCKVGDYPLFIAFINKSTKTMDRVSFIISARVPGYSTDIAEYRTASSDKIIKTGESFGMCYRLPKLSGFAIPSTLDWSLSQIDYRFAD